MMMLFPRLAVSLLFVTLITITAINARAEIGSDIIRDFTPLSGYVIQSVGNEYIIDMDARQQIAVGDLFTVVTPGERIIHPVTKKELGNLDTVKGMLQVTRIKAGFSYARTIGKTSGIKSGDMIRRYQHIDVEFWDYTGHGKNYFIELQQKLSHLQWRGYEASQKTKPVSLKTPAVPSDSIYFILTSQGLEVRSPDFTTIHSYSATEQGIKLPDSPIAQQMTPPTPNEIQKQAPIKTKSAPNPAALWTGPALKGTPIGIETGDFDGDGKQEIAVAFDDRVEIYRLSKENLKLLAKISLGKSLHAYHLDGIDLDKNGRTELYVSAISGSNNLSALSIEHINGQYQITRKDIPWHLRITTLPGEGSVLLAQKMGVQDREFEGPVFRVKLSMDKLSQGATIELPPKTNLYDFAVLPDKSRKLFACLGDNNHLSIITLDGLTLASSIDSVGGNESYMEMNTDAQGAGESRMYFFKARIAVNAAGEIIVPINSGFTILSRAKMYKNSMLKAFKWNGESLEDAWQTSQENNYLAGFNFSDADNSGKASLVTAVSFPNLNPFSERKSALKLYQIP
jgi:hypothetical protein